MTTALSVFGNSTSSTTLSTAETLTDTYTGFGQTSGNTTIGKSTRWGELWSQGTTAAWPSAGSEPSASGHGWLFDDTRLEGQTFVAGTWTPASFHLALKAVTGDIHFRVYKRSSAGLYTLINDFGAAGTAWGTGARVSPAYGNASLAAVAFGVGDKLYIDIVFNITAATTSSTATMDSEYSTGVSPGTATFDLVTPGYNPTAGGFLTPRPQTLLQAVNRSATY